ncbi:Predicted arabinose efflux permease, MFS family [Streptomyces sp. DvalAA-14]|uniref:MFS transporter n=1 Tax=unclassified Streptomyces TaxID=2593676 RepID=UPI00081B8724|nr:MULTISPECIES: MFS transporter [unclassified Streptomyces]MYS24361.1 MFS transporter [Streptomyces sp. SID4948]SCE45287.1 Predicted arabinose efflux permease, MFS family [Streptomyces sp. DvalAA-14]
MSHPADLAPSGHTPDGEASGPASEGPPRSLIVLLAVSCGLTVANLYYAQPLLSELRHTFGISEVTAGGLVTATQLGYAAGLLLLVPLGDVVEKRRLATVLLTLTIGALVLAGLAPDFPVLLIASLIAGTTLVVTQILVPFAADLAPDASRGRVVGQVMSGLLTGILLSRTFGSLLAGATNWRVVYLTSAGLMTVLTLVLRARLPRRAPSGAAVGLTYGALLRSTARLLKVHPALRRRALYQAAMFGAFSVFWTTISYVLTSPPFDYKQWQVGLFALVGAGGALVAPFAGRWADRGLVRPMTGASFVAAAVAFAVAGFGRHNVIALGAAAVVLDMGTQTTLVLGQQVVYQLDGEARARLNSAFMATFFVGGAIGSQAGSYAYHAGGWGAATVLGAALPVVAFLGWTTELRRPKAAYQREG